MPMNSVHLIISKDNSYNAALTKKLLAQHINKTDHVDVFEGKNPELYRIYDSLYTNSLISKNRAVIINNFELLKTDIIEIISRFLISPPEHIFLIMTSGNTNVLKQKQFDPIVSSKIVKKHISMNQSTYSLIRNYIKEHNVRITKSAVDMLTNVFEVSTYGIVENELDKLSTYAGRDGTIDETTVSELTFNLNKSDTFKLVNEILNHKEKAALKDLKSIKETGLDSRMVIGALAWKFRQLLSYSNNKKSVRCINLLYKYNFDIRKGRINNTIALDKLTIELLHEKSY